jgi:hypothetical protein
MKMKKGMFDVDLQWFANPALSQLQSVGDFSLVLTHPLVNGGTTISLIGFKVQGDVVDTDQEMDNAKVVPLIGQIVAIITNTIRAGTLRFSAVRTSGSAALGDIVAISQLLQTIGDNIGGTLRASWSQNGAIQAVTMTTCTVKRCKPLHIQGNDIAEYDVQWVYGDWTLN